MNYFVGILNVKMITLKEKEFRCGKFQWKDTRKENFMFWFRSWSFLIRSSFSSCPFLLNSLFCFVIGCIQQFHCLIILPNNFFRFAVELFSTPKREKKFPVLGKEIIVFLEGAIAQSLKFFCLWKNFEVHSGLQYERL